MGNTSESTDACAICQEDAVKLYQCCPNKADSICETCWSKQISIYMKKGKTGLLLTGELPCDFCNQPMDCDHLPEEIQRQIKNTLSTIPKTKNPKSIEEFNYSYNDSNELRHCLTKEKFIFLTQRHYNLLGSCIDTYIQSLMKSNPWNYEEIWLPIKDEPTNDHHDQVNIFTSNDFQTNENGCLILIQGSGVVRPGQWARSCCINESLDIGSMFPYMTKAKEYKLSVIILNPNQTSYIDEKPTDAEDTISTNTEKNVAAEGTTSPGEEVTSMEGITSPGEESKSEEGTTSHAEDTTKKEGTTSHAEDTTKKEETNSNNELISFYLSTNPLPRPFTKKIPTLSTNREHVLYVYDNIISKCPAKNFYIVAHSAGGDGLMYLLRKRQDTILPTLAKIAFTDSVHSITPFESDDIRNFLKANALHFVASDEPMGEPINDLYDFSQRPACPEVSAGHPKHEYTSGHCVEGVFQFFFPSDKTRDKEIDSTAF